MSRATTSGGSVFGPKVFLAFLFGAGIGLVLVAPVLPDTLEALLADLVVSGGSVIIIGVTALALLMVLLAVFYQGYLKA